MPKLLSGSTLRSGGSNTYIQLNQTQPQFPPDADTSTGYTVVTDSLFVTRTVNSLGNIVHNKGEMFVNLTNTNLVLTGTGTANVVVSRTNVSTGTTSGAFVVLGGVGIDRNLTVRDDIVVNGITIGQGFKGYNNIVLTADAIDTPNDFAEGQNTIVIGRSALRYGLSSSNKNIAIGSYALHSGTFVTNSVAIGDHALQKIGTTPLSYIINITDVTVGGTSTTAVIVTAPAHGFADGNYVNITGVIGTTEINDAYYYIDVIDEDNFILFSDDILNNEVDGTGFTAYSSGGTVTRVLLRTANFALGSNAGANLIDGDQNFFFGDNAGTGLTTGSGNVFIGHNVANYMTQGNDNISIHGTYLQDGVDNQVNIGSIFYYNGTGTLYITCDVFTGDGTNTLSPYEGAFVVNGGVGISDNLFIGGITNIVGSLGVGGIVNISNNTNSTSTTTGALVVTGGVGIGKDLTIGGSLTVGGVGGTGQGSISASQITTTNLTVTGQAIFSSSTNSTSTTSGAVVVTGGVGIGKDLYVGGQIIGPGASGLGTTSTFINIATATTGTYYLGLTEVIGNASRINSTSTLVFNGTSEVLTVPRLTVSSTLTNTSTGTTNIQSLVVSGGAYIAKGIYSDISGNPAENNLVYTPIVTVSTTTPLNPRVGDFWIDPNYGVELQYIDDAGTRFWLQLTGF
jgi:hypothetical protein